MGSAAQSLSSRGRRCRLSFSQTSLSLLVVLLESPSFLFRAQIAPLRSLQYLSDEWPCFLSSDPPHRGWVGGRQAGSSSSKPVLCDVLVTLNVECEVLTAACLSCLTLGPNHHPGKPEEPVPHHVSSFRPDPLLHQKSLNGL